jgi:hypothetical protein
MLPYPASSSLKIPRFMQNRDHGRVDKLLRRIRDDDAYMEKESVVLFKVAQSSASCS